MKKLFILTMAATVLVANVAFSQIGQWTFGQAGNQAGRILLSGSTSGTVRLAPATATATGLKIGTGTIAGIGDTAGLNVGIGASQYANFSDGTGTAFIFTDGNYGIGTYTNHAFLLRTNNTTHETLSTAGAFRWHAYGAGTLTTDASGNITAVSDERLKDIQGDYASGLAAVLQLRPILYRWKPSSGLETQSVYAGFSAQNVQSAMPMAVGATPSSTTKEVFERNSVGEVTKRSESNPVTSYLTIQDRAIIAALVNAIKEQQAQIEQLNLRLK